MTVTGGNRLQGYASLPYESLPAAMVPMQAIPDRRLL